MANSEIHHTVLQDLNKQEDQGKFDDKIPTYKSIKTEDKGKSSVSFKSLNRSKISKHLLEHDALGEDEVTQKEETENIVPK